MVSGPYVSASQLGMIRPKMDAALRIESEYRARLLLMPCSSASAAKGEVVVSDAPEGLVHAFRTHNLESACVVPNVRSCNADAATRERARANSRRNKASRGRA